MRVHASYSFRNANATPPYWTESDMSVILTASWSVQLPLGSTAIGISRGTPRCREGFRRVRELEPGAWFNSVSPQEYLARYSQILAQLDPAEVYERLLEHGEMPVLLCWESAADCHQGKKWCHRHLVAQWLEDRLGVVVQELNCPDLDRFAFLRRAGISAPRFEK
jgi:hypothetical protein